MQKDSGRRRFPLADRVIEVVDDTLTGEVLLDEALKMMKTSEKMSVSSWIDLMSGISSPSAQPATLGRLDSVIEHHAFHILANDGSR